MTVTIQTELEDQIASGARQEGISEEQYVNKLLLKRIVEEPRIVSGSAQAAAKELLAGFLELANTATPVPDRPGEFYSRDMIYADHD